MKKLLLSSAAVCLLTSASAFAGDVNLDVNLGGPAVVVPQPVFAAPSVVIAPEPVFVDRGPGYDPQHHDHKYWEARERHERWEHERMERERREREAREHRDHERHDDHHGHDHHDHHDEHDHDDHR